MCLPHEAFAFFTQVGGKTIDFSRTSFIDVRTPLLLSVCTLPSFHYFNFACVYLDVLMLFLLFYWFDVIYQCFSDLLEHILQCDSFSHFIATLCFLFLISKYIVAIIHSTMPSMFFIIDLSIFSSLISSLLKLISSLQCTFFHSYNNAVSI